MWKKIAEIKITNRLDVRYKAARNASFGFNGEILDNNDDDLKAVETN